MTFEEVKQIRSHPAIESISHPELSKMIDEAVEKQIAKKPEFTFSEDDEVLACCPVCEGNVDWTYQSVWRKGNPKYCRECGQKMKWGDEE